MATPTRAEIEAQWKYAVDLLEDNRAYLDGTMVGLIDTMEQNVEGDYTPGGLVGWGARVRARASEMVDRASARDALTPCIMEYGKFIGSAYRRPDLIWGDIYRYMHDNSLSVNSRDIVYDTPAAAGGNTGNGTLRRLSLDENGYDLEFCSVELKTARCTQDGNSGARRHAESFDFFGVEASKDGLDLSNAGSGQRVTGIRAKHAGSGPGGSLLVNSSFTTYNASGTVTTMYRGWTIAGATANIGTDTTNTYRGHPGDGGTERAIVFNDNEKITQKLTVSGTRLNPGTPYFLRLMYNRQVGSGDGTLTIRLGSASANVVLAAQTGWNELLIAISTNSWPINFYEDDLNIEIELASRTSGTLLVDDVLFCSLDLVDGTYWILVGGTTPFKIDDEFTMTDTGGAAATYKLQYYNWLSGYGYFPSATGGGETWTDP